MELPELLSLLVDCAEEIRKGDETCEGEGISKFPHVM